MIAEYEDWYKECWYALLLSIVCKINPDSAYESIIKGKVVPYIDDLIQLRNEGMSYIQIEKLMNITKHTAHKSIARINPKRQKEMVEMWESGKTIKEICLTMDTTITTIHKALKEQSVIR